MRCPKCGALAADSDPYCLWCGKGLNHSRSARPDPTGRSGPGGQPSLAARMLVGIGVAAMILGMFVVRMVVEGNPLSDFKGVIAGVVCVFVPMLGLCFLVWLLGKSRGGQGPMTNDQTTGHWSFCKDRFFISHSDFPQVRRPFQAQVGGDLPSPLWTRPPVRRGAVWGFPMFAALRHLRTATLPIAVLLFTDPAEARAGWMGFRNDTGMTLVIQETGGSRSGRPQKIFANETIRDTPPTAGAVRTFAIYETGKADKPLHTGPFATPLTAENVLYVIKPDGKGGLVIEAIKTQATSGVVKKSAPKR